MTSLEAQISKESACEAGDPDSIPGSGKFHVEGNGYPLQYSCLENSMDRGAWWATVHGVAKSDMIERLTILHIFKCFPYKIKTFKYSYLVIAGLMILHNTHMKHRFHFKRI